MVTIVEADDAVADPLWTYGPVRGVSSFAEGLFDERREGRSIGSGEHVHDRVWVLGVGGLCDQCLCEVGLARVRRIAASRLGYQ